MFDDVIRGLCTRTVFYASPLLQPTALSRAWCLYEIMKTIAHGKKLLVGLSAADREGLKMLITNDFDRILTMFSSIKSENAEATRIEDKEMIFEWIRDLGDEGFKKLDDIVSGRMRAWMAQTGAKIASQSENSKLLNSVGRLLKNLAQYKEAEPFFRRALAVEEAVHGEDHSNVAYSLNKLANVLLNQAKYEEAEPLCRRSLAIRETVHGPDHHDVAFSLVSLRLYSKTKPSTMKRSCYPAALSRSWRQCTGQTTPTWHLLSSVWQLYFDT
jgi:tetratricopeptide (TPR) repeat protein